MFALLRSLAAPLLSLVFMMMASGLFNTFVSIRLEIEGFSVEDIGIVAASMYLGILLGSLWIDRWISRVGHVRSFVAFAAALTFLILSQAFWINPWYWSLIRLLGGVCMAGVFIVIESWLLMGSAPHLRGAILSIYLAVLYAALSCGQLLIDLSDPAGPYPFCIAAVFLTASILPVSLLKISPPKLTQTERLGLMQLYRISPHGFLGGVISGMLLAVIYGLGPVYAREIGMGVSEIGTFMAVLIFGGFSLQLPMGRWADKTDRRRVLNIASFVTTLLALSIGLIETPPPLLLLGLAWLFGGFAFTLYPLSMAYACEKVKEGQLIAATGGFVVSYGLGAIGGPLLAPLAMDLFGTAGLFYFLAAITFVLGIIGLKRPASALLDE